MEGLTKSAEQTQPTQVTPAKDTQPMNKKENIIHDEVYRYFNIASYDSSNIEHLNIVNDWALKDNNIGKGLRKLRTLEIKLGAPAIGETRMSKLYNWIRLSDHINSVHNEMDKELGKVGMRAKEIVSNVRQTYEDRVEKLDAEIAIIVKAHKKTTQLYRLNATQSSKKIRDKYGEQLDELKEMRAAFKGEK